MSRLSRLAPPPPPLVKAPAPPALEPTPAPEPAPVAEAAPEPQPAAEEPKAKPAAAKGSGRLSAVPTTKETPNNLFLPSELFVDLGIKVEAEFRQRVKVEAATRGMTNKELIQAAVQLYLDTFPTTGEKVQVRGPSKETLQRRRALRLEREQRLTRIKGRAPGKSVSPFQNRKSGSGEEGTGE